MDPETGKGKSSWGSHAAHLYSELRWTASSEKYTCSNNQPEVLQSHLFTSFCFLYFCFTIHSLKNKIKRLYSSRFKLLVLWKLQQETSRIILKLIPNGQQLLTSITTFKQADQWQPYTSENWPIGNSHIPEILCLWLNGNLFIIASVSESAVPESHASQKEKNTFDRISMKEEKNVKSYHFPTIT